MTTIAIDHLGLAFAGYIFFAVVLAVFFGRALGLNDRLAREQYAERREVDGPMASIADFAAEREARANRATLAQRERWGRSA